MVSSHYFYKIIVMFAHCYIVSTIPILYPTKWFKVTIPI